MNSYHLRTLGNRVVRAEQNWDYAYERLCDAVGNWESDHAYYATIYLVRASRRVLKAQQELEQALECHD